MAKILNSNINVKDWQSERGITERTVELKVKVQFSSDEELMKVFNHYEELKLNLKQIRPY